MKKGLSLVFCFILLFSLCSCGCEHEWKEATCTSPKTCVKCNATEGEALGHDWKEADCSSPKTCSRCGATEGEALGHDWKDATCTSPKTCSRCGATEGEALGHDWKDATCTEPKTCSRCGEKSGEALSHTTRFGVCSRCGQKITELSGTYQNIIKDSREAFSQMKNAQSAVSDELDVMTNALLVTKDTNYFAADFTTTYSYINSAKNSIKRAYDECGDYKEFAELKSKIKSSYDEISRLSNLPKPTTNVSARSFFGDFTDVMGRILTFGDYIEANYDKMTALLNI